MLRTRVLLTALGLGGSAIAFLAHTWILSSFGASIELDRYIAASSVPLSVAGTISGVLVYLLPQYMTTLDEEDKWLLLIGGSLTIFSAGVLATAAVTISMAVHFNISTIGLATLFIGVATLSLATTLFVCAAQSVGSYLSSGSIPFVSALGLFAGAAGSISFTEFWFFPIGQFFGVIAAYLLSLGSVSAPVYKKRNFSLKRFFAIGKPLLSQATPIALGTIAFTLFPMLDAWLCRNLPSGSLSIMAYSQRIAVALGTAISFGAFAVAARLSRDVLIQRGISAVISMANKEAARILFLGVVAWVIFRLFGVPALEVALASDNFESEQVDQLAKVLNWVIFGVGPMAVTPYIFRIFYTLRMFKTPAVIGIILPFIYVVGGSLASKEFGVAGLGAVYATTWWLALIASAMALNFPRFSGDKLS